MKQIKVYKLTLLFISFFFLLHSCDEIEPKTLQSNLIEKPKDSISIWIKYSSRNSYSKKQQKKFLSRAYKEIVSKPEKNSKAKNLSSVAFRYYQLKDTILFNKINRETLDLAIKLKDSFNIADAHWNYATYFLNGEIYDKSYKHFTIAYKHFNGIKKTYNAARMLYTMSFIKARYRDYSGSEVLTFEAIKEFNYLKNYKYLYKSYNRLGLIQNDIQEYDKALSYHQKALNYLKKMDNKNNYYAISLNNIGLTYLEKKEYKKSIEYFNKSLSQNTERENFARTIANRALSQLYLNDTINVKKDLYKALYIRDSMHNKAGIVASNIYLSKYYAYIKDTIQAIQYSKEANVLAYKIKNGSDYLNSLQLLADLDLKNSTKYLERYIQYDDSLSTVERKTLDKFTRIEFQTDEYIEDNQRLSEQKLWITGSGIGVVLILSLIYFLKVQRSKNEKLLLEAEQQKANEQVYLLTLKQQATLEEEKVQERNRISQELHDGILGRLFGTRMGLGFLDLEGGEASKEQHQSFLDELQDIEKEIRDVSHKLSENFSNSEINFTTIIDQLLKDKSQLGNFQTELNIDKNISWNGINEIIKVNVYRIVQESLQNIIKHAKAKHVTLGLSTDEKHLDLILKDDGVGFSVKKAKKGIGLKNIQSRVKKLKGNLEINSATNKGTTLHIKIPIQ
ncbi:MAG: sensor histidine kinase [Flavobacteriaceae bacterium]